MMDNIDNIVDKALRKPRKIASRKTLEEPEHIFVHHWFKTWKMFKYETPSQNIAYDKFNDVMKKLSQRNDMVVDAKRSRVMLKDISPACTTYANLKYVVEVYWRDKELRDGQ